MPKSLLDWGLIMTIDSSASSNQPTPISQVRTLIANHLGVSIGRITDEAHFTDDLGADWLDRLELLMVIEDQFAGVEITDTDIDQIEVVGDLIHYIETASTGCNN
jgi:acyl carrier protein